MTRSTGRREARVLRALAIERERRARGDRDALLVAVAIEQLSRPVSYEIQRAPYQRLVRAARAARRDAP